MAKLLDKLTSIQYDAEDLSPKNVEWMWEVKELTPFLDWFVKYLDDENFINSRQLQRYETLCHDGNELSGRELDLALEECGIDVQKMFYSTLSDGDLELCEQEVDSLRVQNECAHEVDCILSEQNKKSLSHEQSMEAKLKAAQVACQREGQNLMKINVPLKATISGLFNNLSKLAATFKDTEDPDVRNCCITNMPLESILNVSGKFGEYASLCLKRKFEQSSYSDKNSVLELMSFLDGNSSLRASPDMINDLPNRIWKADVNRMAMHGKLMGYTSAIRYLESLFRSPVLEKLTPFQMKIEVDKLQDEILRLSEDISLYLKYEVSNMVEDAVLCNITRVVERTTKNRIERRQLLLRKLCSVASVTTKFLHVIDIVWMLIKVESQQFKNGTDLLLDISNYFTDDFNRHKATMSGLNTVMNEYNLGADTLRPGQAALLNNIQRLLDNVTNDSDSGNSTLLEKQQKDLECIQLSDIVNSHHEKYLECEKDIYELLNELTNGPNKKPNLVKKEIVQALQEIDVHLQQCGDRSHDLTSLYNAKQVSFKTSPVAQNRRLLWVWFLVAHDNRSGYSAYS